jgi:hypothetical protein
MQLPDHFANVLFVLQLLIWITTSCLMDMFFPSSLLNNLIIFLEGGGHINQFYIFDIPFQTTNFLLSFALTMKNCLHMM